MQSYPAMNTRPKSIEPGFPLANLLAKTCSTISKRCAALRTCNFYSRFNSSRSLTRTNTTIHQSALPNRIEFHTCTRCSGNHCVVKIFSIIHHKSSASFQIKYLKRIFQPHEWTKHFVAGSKGNGCDPWPAKRVSTGALANCTERAGILRTSLLILCRS